MVLVVALVQAGWYTTEEIGRTSAFAENSDRYLQEGVHSEAVGKAVRPLLDRNDSLLIHTSYGGFGVPVHAMHVRSSTTTLVGELRPETVEGGQILVTPVSPLGDRLTTN